MMENSGENLSDSMEMYLVTVARLRQGNQPVPLSKLAETLLVTSVSVNEMCRKLQDNGLLIYRPYKGAVLTETGEKLANHTLRRHRLWEVFLVEKLHFKRDQADEMACELEHATTDEVIDRLDEYLNYPTVSPRGYPIPKSDNALNQSPAIALTELTVGKSGRIVRCETSGAASEFLAQTGIRPGVSVSLVAAGKDNLLVELDGEQLMLTGDLAGVVFVSPEQMDVDGSEAENTEAHIEKNGQKDIEPMENQATTIRQIPLSELKKGQQAVIVGVGGKGAVKRRMMDMGVVPGSQISVVRVAPFGDPIEFSIKGYRLSLRKSEASEIIVELND